MKVGKTEYNRIHKWCERSLEKTGICLYCNKTKKTQWSNIDHQYRQDPTEYQEVCPSCHNDFDIVMLGKKGGLTYDWYINNQ